MAKHLLAAFLVIMLISSLADGKTTVGQKVKNAAKKVYNKVKELVGQSEYGCPLVSSFCEQFCERKAQKGNCDGFECLCA
uniref:CSab-Uro-2 n=1 Tax=Urodacus manicatus TaxID=1330407 RepID=T1DMR6_UROMN